MPNQREQGEQSPQNHTEAHINSELSRFLQGWGLFSGYTPKGKDPTCFPIQVIDQKSYETDMQVHNAPQIDLLLTQVWPDWSKSIRKIQMAYEVTVFPRLEVAERQFAKITPHDLSEHGPAAYQSSITEAIRDAQDNPGKDLDEHPHRGAIELNDQELAILARIAKARGLPHPEKPVFRYTDHLPLLEARHQALMRSPITRATQDSMIKQGILRPRVEIEQEIRQRQARLLSGSAKDHRQPKPQK